MHSEQFLGLDCVALENKSLTLLITRSVGPRIIALRLNGGENLLAELPDFTAQSPAFGTYHFYGGHRLWCAPEHPDQTYVPDDHPVSIVQAGKDLRVVKPVEAPTGIEKSLHIALVKDDPEVIIKHTLTNRGQQPVECAPWAITQLKAGGTALLPQSTSSTGLAPNRVLTLWPYTDITSAAIRPGNRIIFVEAETPGRALKLGFPNPRGWLAYYRAGILFVKKAAFDRSASYYDSGSSSECYCNDRFLELETLGPITTLAPGQSVSHVETWQLFANVEFSADETSVHQLVERLGLEP